VKFQGRHIDAIALWSQWVEFPANFSLEEDSEFAPLVQCPNPDHNTEKRHFQINLDKPLVHCFAGCGISGTYEHAIAMIEGTKPRETRKLILKHSRMGPVRKKRKRSPGSDAAISPNLLQYERYIPPFGLEYLQKRGISSASVARWELGWDASERRIVIPVKDIKGRTRMLIRRAVREKDRPKYLYTEGVARNSLLFGACQIDLGLVKSFGVVLVEGSIDAIMQHQQGFPTTMAILGSKLSEIQARHIMNLRPRRVYTMFDADASGVSATLSVIQRLPMLPISVIRYPKGVSDPAELDRESRQRVFRRAVSKREFQKLVKTTTRSQSDLKGIRVG
jgi:DNA primase